MAVRGVSPSYFAGMPTVARDPRAGQVDPSYAAMPGQALSEANQLNQRRHEFDSGEAFRARDQSHREQQDATSGAREDRRLGMYQQGEDRRQVQQGFENDRLKSADTQRLATALQQAMDDNEWGIADIIGQELRSRGINVKPITGKRPAAAPPGASAQPPGAGAPEIGSQDMSWIESGKGTNPMSAADATTSKQLDQAGASILPKLRGNAPSKPADANLASQLDAAGQKYSKGLSGGAPTPMPYDQAMRMANQSGALGVKQVPGGWAPIVEGDDDTGTPYQAQPRKGLLPGRRMGVAQSNAMLSPDDPLNKIGQKPNWRGDPGF